MADRGLGEGGSKMITNRFDKEEDWEYYRSLPGFNFDGVVDPSKYPCIIVSDDHQTDYTFVYESDFR